MKQRSRLRHLAEYVLFRLLVCLIDVLPARACVRMAEIMAFVVTRLLPKKLTRFDVARRNIRTAFGDSLTDEEIESLVRRMWVHLFRMVAEIVHLPRKLRLYNCAEVVRFRNRERTVRAMCAGRPVIVISGHFGNWEMATAMFGLFGFRLGVVARDLDNPYLHEWFRRWRQRTGHRLISKKGGGGEMVELLERRGGLALLGDQDAGSRGLFVPFFGRDASTFKSIALLALHHRAVVCVGYARRLPDDFRRFRWVRYEVGCEEVLDADEFDGPAAVRELTARYTAALERIIRLSPEQYFWVHRRWKSRPASRRRVKHAA